MIKALSLALYYSCHLCPDGLKPGQSAFSAPGLPGQAGENHVTKLLGAVSALLDPGDPLTYFLDSSYVLKSKWLFIDLHRSSLSLCPTLAFASLLILPLNSTEEIGGHRP